MLFTIYPAELGQYRWNLKSANHEKICSGESYHNKADCLAAIQLVNGLNHYPIRDLTPLAPPLGVDISSTWLAAKAGIGPVPVPNGLLSPAAIASKGLLAHAMESVSPRWYPNGLLSEHMKNAFGLVK